MLRTTITLSEKKQLTHDVFELTYVCPEMTKEPPKPGQYVMFQLAPGLNRAYSIAIIHDTTFTLIIKRITDGRWSPLLCDAEIGSSFSGMIPLWHFTLQDTPRSKCFIGTGTGFAPLYCQMLRYAQSPWEKKVGFIFGVRNFADSFYESEITDVGSRCTDFMYIQYFSREENFESRMQYARHGYVTDAIDIDLIREYEEYYICGSPVMVKSAREKLEALGVMKEDILWEQF
jgi:NAD(P)H-flavin reductase